MNRVACGDQQLLKVLPEKCACADQTDDGKILYATLYDFVTSVCMV